MKHISMKTIFHVDFVTNNLLHKKGANDRVIKHFLHKEFPCRICNKEFVSLGMKKLN